MNISNFTVVPSDLQLLIVAFIALQGWAISQHARQHRFFVYWAWGWFWLAVLIVLGRIMPFIVSADLPLGSSAIRTCGTVVGLLQLYCFALGAWALSDRPPLAQHHKRTFLAVVLLIGAVLGYMVGITESPAQSTAIAFVLRHLGLATVFTYSAWLLYAQRSNATGVASALTSISLLLYGLHLLYYAAGDISTLIDMTTGFAPLPYDSMVVFGDVNWVIDMTLSVFLGIGVLMLLISEMRRARASIHRSEAEFRGTFDHAPIGMALLIGSGEIVRANTALGDLLELPAETLSGSKLNRFLREEAGKEQTGDLFFAVTQETRRRFQALMESGSGREIHAVLNISTLPGTDGEHSRFIAQVLDVTDQHNLQERLSHLAMHDEVTGLPNRAYLQEHLHAAVKRMQRRGTPMAVMFADLNKFKPVNDTYGHVAGDSVLQAVAQRLKSTLREGDFISRFGGDEFVIVIEESPGHDGLMVAAQRIINSVAQPVRIDDAVVEVSLSLGIVISGLHDEADDLLRAADAVMYRVKEAGGEKPELTDRSA